MNILTKMLRVMWIRDYRRALLGARVVASTEHDRIRADCNSTQSSTRANRGQFARASATCIRTRRYSRSNH